ncbi:MFS transporter [Paenarthrobacter aurescens]|uniref:Membrane protein n=1 Tax=Paenarthrobacter aurescens TaxID=43663 RepID=A0A4Y3NBD9_PAEAU|nr:MFS transporter [Paenarthrobacter aurescens]MDO6141774.1 MFS transporter [Paenarthrobacter aurescens]MDO6149537.1 MFS transporter [Paenarthrobacter aurescens]MDO6156823.1 MFS transporter [Paenarthrobacter aurescens]MDO6160809.1 MFS transporter [Paenarthrobacter aurescens]GEB18573.1 membrane protein [Paenarthrobacter aurescens]
MTKSPASTAPAQKHSLRGALSDPMLKILASAILIATLGRGIFLTLTVLYFSRFVGLTAFEIAMILTVSSGVGVATSYIGGRLADHFSARRLLVGMVTIEGLAIASYTFAGNFSTAVVIACIAVGVNRGANATRSAIIARAFDGPSRVNARAVLRTITNLGIAVGGMIAGLALLAGTAEAFRAMMVCAGVVYILSALHLRRLPQRVDAPRRDPAKPAPKRGISPFRDRRYVLLTVLSGIFGMQFGLAEMGVPLWISQDTSAPDVLISVILVINTLCVVLLQVPLSRGTDHPRRAGKIVMTSGTLMAVACVLYSSAGGAPVIAAIALLCGAALLHAFAEILSQAGAWGLSFELANPLQAGAYQGMFGMGSALGAMLAPLVVTATVVEHGALGWAMLGAVFLASPSGTWLIARKASTTPAAA